ncbi:response regulator [bacterium]|nr:response regulator [bacterium]
MNHILIVDDDVNFRRSLIIQLEFEGFEVKGYESCQQAFSFLNQNKNKTHFPDVIITDIRMPDMRGDEFVLKMQNEYPSIPLIMISAFDPPDPVRNFPFLHKPFKIMEMVDLIANVGQNENR